MIKLRISSLIFTVVSLLVTGPIRAQSIDDESITEEMLLNPDPADWLLFSRTYDNHRFSPLDQVKPQQCRPAFDGMVAGNTHRNAANHPPGASRCDVCHSSCL